jgi:hypothetical protein
MAYTPTRSLLSDNLPLLESLLSHALKGEPLHLSYTPEEIGSAHYKLNRILNATQVFKDFKEGKFLSLRSLISFKFSPLDSTITSIPRALSFVPQKRTYLEALASLSADETSSVSMIEFHPTSDFNPSQDKEDLQHLFIKCSEIGWLLHHKALLTDENTGEISIGVSRVEEEEKATGFAALTSHQKGS